MFRFVVAEGQGRSQAQRLAFEEEPVGQEALLDEGLLYGQDAVKGVEHDGEEGAAAADFAHGGVVFEAAAKLGLEGGGAQREAVARQDGPGRQAGRAAHGVAAKGGKVAEHGVFGQGGHEGAVGGKGPEGHAAAQGLRQAEDVGGDSGRGEGEGLAAAAEAGLDFVDDEQGSGRAAPRLEGAQPGEVGGHIAGFRLNDFDQDGGGVGADGVEGLAAVERKDSVARHQRAVGRLHALVAHGREGSGGGSVVGPDERDDFAAAGGALGQFEGAVDGFGSGIAPVNLVERGRKGRQQGFCVGDLGQLGVFAVDHQVHVLGGLMLDRRDDFGMAVSEVGHADARNEVHVGLALGVVEVDALSPHKF